MVLCSLTGQPSLAALRAIAIASIHAVQQLLLAEVRANIHAVYHGPALQRSSGGLNMSG